MISKLKIHIEPKLSSLGKKLYWIHPNIITVIGLIPPILFLLFMKQEQFGWAIIMLVLSALDILDGVVARANNRVTKFGAFLDSTLDRISDFLIILGLYFGHLAGLELVALLLLFTFLISYTRSRVESLVSGINFAHGLMERTERVVLIFIILLFRILLPNAHILSFQLSEVLISILTLLCFYTVIQRVYYAYKKL